jgi:Spx/MgsR family transcriptional regulator
MKVYGIKTCDTVRKALKYLKEKGIDFDFVDLKKEPVGYETVDRWLEKVDIAMLFNKRGTKYRMLKLKDLNLDEAGMRDWLCKENLLIKRPVVELDDGRVIVGFKPEQYDEVFDK